MKSKGIREKALHKEFIRVLLKSPVKNIKFSKKKVSLTFFKHKISDNVIVRFEKHVAEWSRKRKEVYIDKRFNKREMKKSFKALCVHEVIEKFLTERFGFNVDTEAHVVATRKEKEYLESINGNWKSHQDTVHWDWHNHGER